MPRTKQKNKSAAKPRRTITIPIIGTVGDKGVKLKPEFEQEDEETRVLREARTVAAFLEGGPPDFLMEAMLSAIGDAFDHFWLRKPDDDGGLADYDEQNLRPLFEKTKMLSWGDLWTDEQKVADAVLELLHNSKTPNHLFEAVAGFLCDQSNERTAPNLFHTAWGVKELLQSVPPEELRGNVA